jgi:hypothetical protein
LYILPEGKIVTYPSPAKGPTLWFYYHLSGPAKIYIDIYNPAGEKVFIVEDEKAAGGYVKTPWDIRQVAPGLYVYRLKYEDSNGMHDSGLKRLVIVK